MTWDLVPVLLLSVPITVVDRVAAFVLAQPRLTLDGLSMKRVGRLRLHNYRDSLQIRVEDMAPVGKWNQSGLRSSPSGSHGRDMLNWIDAEGVAHIAPADSRATGLGLDRARVCRQAIKYPHRRNYEGYYWFSRTGQHLWYESLTEYTALMWLDFSQAIVGISTQPFCIVFADGALHFPDIFAVLEDGTQSLYDVRPQSLIDEKPAQLFAKTRGVCEHIGWPYQILGELEQPMRHNLEWLAAYRHPRYRPSPEVRENIANCLTTPAKLLEVAQAVNAKAPAFGIHYVYNLLWTRDLHADLARPLSWSTYLERGDSV